MFSDTNRQLRKLSIYKPMQFRITDIEFDFEDSQGELPYDEQVAIVDEVLATTWEASDSEDLVEEITCATGFCVKNVDYCYVLQ
jgi:hypothetical protein|nr:hypothetical protein [uncultured Mediterranean phage uvMED]|tara:strand:- start:593 stop:844 length:252 start_codon:yes stop_codon:yes gene_type:complete